MDKFSCFDHLDLWMSKYLFYCCISNKTMKHYAKETLTALSYIISILGFPFLLLNLILCIKISQFSFFLPDQFLVLNWKFQSNLLSLFAPRYVWLAFCSFQWKPYFSSFYFAFLFSIISFSVIYFLSLNWLGFLLTPLETLNFSERNEIL